MFGGWVCEISTQVLKGLRSERFVCGGEMGGPWRESEARRLGAGGDRVGNTATGWDNFNWRKLGMRARRRKGFPPAAPIRQDWGLKVSSGVYSRWAV